MSGGDIVDIAGDRRPKFRLDSAVLLDAPAQGPCSFCPLIEGQVLRCLDVRGVPFQAYTKLGGERP